MSRVARSVLFGLAVLTTGCGLLQGRPQSEALDALVEGSQMSAGELRIRVRSLAAPFSGELESVANRITEAEERQSVAQAMTRFKFEAIPAMQAALFQPDPVAALVDAWAFIVQLRHAVERIDEGNLSERSLAIARERFRAMDQRMLQLWSALAGNRRESREQARMIHAWARENPVSDISGRPTTERLLAELSSRGGISPMGAAAALIETTQDFGARADLINTWLPKQARWHAEYFTRQVLTDPTLLGEESSVLSALLVSLGNVLGLTEDLPGTLATERDAAFSALSDERSAVQDFVSGERQSIADDLRAERRAIVEELREERRAIAEFFREERRATLREIDAMVRGWINRVFLLSLALLALAVLGGLALLALRRRWRPAAREPEPSPT